jgi:hypothetical protein
MPGLDPGIHLSKKWMDRRVKPGDDEQYQSHGLFGSKRFSRPFQQSA